MAPTWHVPTATGTQGACEGATLSCLEERAAMIQSPAKQENVPPLLLPEAQTLS